MKNTITNRFPALSENAVLRYLAFSNLYIHFDNHLKKVNRLEAMQLAVDEQELITVVLKDEDASAIFAYLNSSKPVSSVVPQPIPTDQM